MSATHTIRFSKIHKSVIALVTTTLPQFTVLTGKNGSGKTHLLEAIKNGSVSSTLVSNTENDVQYFDWANIIPKDTGTFSPAQHLTQRGNWFSQIKRKQEEIFPKLRQQIMGFGIPSEHCGTMSAIESLSPQKISEVTNKRLVEASQIYNELARYLDAAGKNIYSAMKVNDEAWKRWAPKLVQHEPRRFLETSEDKFFSNDHFLWGQVDPFQQAFGRMFSVYRGLVHANDRLEKYPIENGDKHLSPDEFEKKHGQPPWDFVNKILETCRLDFRVNSPPMHEIGIYEPKLKKVSSFVEMKFQDLSSGEKVLMSFALCLYNAEESRQQKVFPKLLLLDEVDAPLHPSMVASLLRTIQEVLIRDKGVSVILTTHNPTTVALSPEDALYEVRPDGPIISKVSKNRAVSILTDGVPTLSVTFEGRRQVFVESSTDAKLYERLYQLSKDALNSERSLVFVEVGRRTAGGLEQNGGCEQVVRIVEELAKAGNQSVFGLIDWDGYKTASRRVHVLCPGIRNGMESLLFDPVLIISAALREDKNSCDKLGLSMESDKYSELGLWSKDKWQEAVNRLQKLLFASTPAKTVEVTYQGGMTLIVDRHHLEMDDHALEKIILEKIPFLRAKSRRAGELMEFVTNSVIYDFPGLMPSDLISTFRGLLEAAVED